MYNNFWQFFKQFYFSSFIQKQYREGKRVKPQYKFERVILKWLYKYYFS